MGSNIHGLAAEEAEQDSLYGLDVSGEALQPEKCTDDKRACLLGMCAVPTASSHRTTLGNFSSCIAGGGSVCVILYLMRSVFISLALSVSVLAADWPQFLGPARTGIADASENPLPDVFPSDLQPLWKKSVGSGFSGPLVVGGKVIIFHREGSDMTTEALEAATGKPIWRSTYITDYIDSFGFDNGPRATPAVADGRVITYGPEGRATALDFSNGKEVWNFDTASALESPQGFFGRAPSPLVVGKQVIIASGGTQGEKPAGLTALDIATGKVSWNAVDDEAAYASPVLAGGNLLAWMRNQLWLLDAQGSVLTSRPLRSSMDASVNAATPVPLGGDRWLVSAGYGVGAHLLKVTDGKIESIWQKEDTLDCHYNTPIRVGEHLYAFHGRQETGMNLRCIRIEDGSVAWTASDSLPGGTLLAVGDKLLVVTEQGELWIVRATPERFDRLAAIQILRAGHRSHAAYADGILYARDTEHLIALKLR
jgi:outer membrane protein assembly factor BamB